MKTPNLLNCSGNLVLSVANDSSVVPYVTGGVGGLTVFEKASLGINETETFLTGNVGGASSSSTAAWASAATIVSSRFEPGTMQAVDSEHRVSLGRRRATATAYTGAFSSTFRADTHRDLSEVAQ